MSGESLARSNLIDVTYSQLHLILSGNLEGVSLDQLREYLNPRKEQVANATEPFGKPTDASRKKIESGSVTLEDGVVLNVEDPDKEFVFAISSKFQIDEVQALVLLRSFLYNEGLPPTVESTSTSSLITELVEAITPFYSSERLSVLRILIPLFRAKQDVADPNYEIASDFLPKVLPDGPKFADSIVKEYIRKCGSKLPEQLSGDPKTASQWAKQNLKEQLVILEVLFWTMWSYVSCSGPLVEAIFEAAYSTNLGSKQANTIQLLDEESYQLQQDGAALWILITVEVLELESLAEADLSEASDDPDSKDLYFRSPECLGRIHNLVLSHEDSQFVCTYLAWSYVLSRIALKASESKDVPEGYHKFLGTLSPFSTRSFSKTRSAVHEQMSTKCLNPDVGLFQLILSLLTNSPLFVTDIAWKRGSSVTDPNAIAFRSVLKGLIIALVELVPVELIPEFDAFVEVWIALFGRSESQSITGICAQFWQNDWYHGNARRAILDVARSRFPVQTRPLVRLLRAMSATGFLDTHDLVAADGSQEGAEMNEDREICGRFVFHYLLRLSTFSQVIPTSACSGPHPLYERQQDRYGTSNSSAGLTYVNTRPIKLPGGSTLPARSSGHLLSGDGEDYIVLSWQYEHNGWKLLLEILTAYVYNKQLPLGASGAYRDVSFGRRDNQLLTLQLKDIGMEIDSEGEDSLITDILDLVRSIVQDNSIEAEQLMASMEAGDPVVSHTMTEAQPPDLVQLTTMILEEALSRSRGGARITPPAQLITSAMSVLSALLALPNYSNRVWLYIRSTSVLFGSDTTAGFASIALAAERAVGHYTMTNGLLHLVQQLFREASSNILPDNPRLQQLKEEVLLRAVKFVHTEIWVEHLGWKYAQLGDRFEIGRRVTSLFVDIMEHAPFNLTEKPFSTLSQTIADILLFKATTSTINPLVSSVASGAQMLRVLYGSRRFGDARRLIFLLGSHLRLCRVVLNLKQKTSASTRQCLLEQSLCARITAGATSHDSIRVKVNPIDVLAGYVKDRDVGNTVPFEAIRVLYALCASLSSSQPSPTIVGHLSNPESTVASLVRIVQHPYDDLSLRITIWNFISLAVDREPALANLFVTGQFHTPIEVKGKTLIENKPTESVDKTTLSAMGVARDMLANWKSMWEANPQLLSSVFRFLDVVWQHGLEHKTTLQTLWKDSDFWNQIVSVICEEIGPIPDFEATEFLLLDGVRHSNFHEATSMHSYRTLIKSYAVHIIGLDISFYFQLQTPGSKDKPQSYLAIDQHFKFHEQLTDLLSEAAPSSYVPELHDKLLNHLESTFVGLKLEQLELQVLPHEREYGDNFTFSIPLLRRRLQAYQVETDMVDVKEMVELELISINLNLSLVNSQTALADAWEFLLRNVSPYLKGDAIVRPTLLSVAASISDNIANEQRSGDMMSTIHGTRLSLLLAILELAWFSPSDKSLEIQSFMELLRSVKGIIFNEAQPPSRSILGVLSVPFHRTLLQVVYFCVKHSRNMLARPKVLNADQRLTITLVVEATINLVIDALRVVFISARSRQDVELDRDMELLVVLFEQCTQRDINPSSTAWLVRCQETDVIRVSLDLYAHIDLVGLSDLPLLLTRKQPLYAPHILLFHMSLVSNPIAAERFGSEGVLAAYSNNFISSAISAGQISVVLPELPGERSPAHLAYCSMISIVATVITALGRQNHYFDAEACGFVQLFGDQVSRALSWTVGDSITLPLVEEIEQVVNLFYSIAASAPTAATANPVVNKVLRFFSLHALQLLQQLNYAVTHPHHLASLFEPITNDERIQLEKDTCSGDPIKRPIIAHLVQRLFGLCCNIVGTLVTISKADMVLLTTQEDWPLSEALIVPHSKVVVGEPASLGTLLELGNCTLDKLRELVQQPNAQSQAVVERSKASCLSATYSDNQRAVISSRRNLEGILLYSITQLAMWLAKPDFDSSAVDVDIEDQQATDMQRSEVGKERRARQTLPDRLRRSMTGEMAGDIQALLTKAKPVIAKSDSVIGKESVDLTQMLSNFLSEKISAPS